MTVWTGSYKFKKLITGGRNPKTKKLLDTTEILLNRKTCQWNTTAIRLPKPDAGHAVHAYHFFCFERYIKVVRLIITIEVIEFDALKNYHI